MLIVVTNVRSKMWTALRLVLLLSIFSLVILSANNILTDLAGNEDLDHAPGQPVRVENEQGSFIPTEGSLDSEIDGTSIEKELPKVEEEKEDDWMDSFIDKLKKYYQGND